MIEKNENFPNGYEAVMLVVALAIVQYLICAGLYDLRDVLGIDPQDQWGVMVVAGNAVIFTIVMHHKGLTYRQLFHSSSSSVGATLAVLAPAIALTVPALVLLMSSLFGLLVRLFPLTTWEASAFARMGSGSFSSVVVVCILAPVLEEMFFRGIILRSFLRQFSRWQAIVGSAALFGFAHLNLYQYVVAVIMGIFLGWLYERTRSLVPCIVLHAAYNTAGILSDWDANYALGGVSGYAWGAALVLGVTGMLALRRVLLVPAHGQR